MTPEEFFELFLQELKSNDEMNHYYKFLGDDKNFDFRKNYFLERLRYIYQHLNDRNLNIYDCGCGYGTTCFFLAMNGVASYGETLEFYYEQINRRKEYWKQFGNVELFTYSYENLFDRPITPNQYDAIIVQDTLHHLEPIDEAMQRLHQLMKPKGQMVVIEENGSNLLQRIILYKRRGNKRIIEIWDDKLQKKILLGNENIRSLQHWKGILSKAQFHLNENSVQYIRYFLPFNYKEGNAETLLKKERKLSQADTWKREYLFFGINFIAEKN